MKVEALKEFAMAQDASYARLWDDMDYEMMLLENSDDLELAKDSVVAQLMWASSVGWEDDSNGEQLLCDGQEIMNYNSVMAILFVAIALFASVAVYSDSQTTRAAMQTGLQECMVKLDFGYAKLWQKECPK